VGNKRLGELFVDRKFCYVVSIEVGREGREGNCVLTADCVRWIG
jgi:hypothetical protein